MGFHDRLVAETKADQEALFAAPFVRSALSGHLDLEGYLAFLGQAYHHVRHTVPLMMATGAALPGRHRWLLEPLCEYIDEEAGHEEWILADITACGGDAEAVRHSRPDFPCELMVSFAYDVAQRRNPLGFFGMVHVLEGASTRGASAAASVVIAKLGIPSEGTTYLTSHGSLDQEHVAFFRGLMDRIEDACDQDFILHCAHRFFRLYGDIFRGLPLPDANQETS
jgi:hypothetical protein